MFFRSIRHTTLLLFIVPIVLFLIALSIYGWKSGGFVKTARAQYQAVFLTNGQVYFGKVRNRTSSFVAITDIYYLQTRQPLQETGDTKEKDAKPAEPELTLVKLGDELHGPTDRMEVNRDQILFIEDLRSDGKVATAIARYKSGGK